MTVTMQDVARYAAVSVATVSRVLSHPDVVNKETRERVYEAIQALGYRLNTSARNLRTQKTGYIAILVSSQLEQPLYEALEKALLPQGYLLLLCTTQGNLAVAQDYLNRLTEQRADGIIWVAPSPDEIKLAQELPTVVLNTRTTRYASFYGDEYDAMYKLTDHLLEKGHEQIALFSHAASQLEGYRDAFADHSLDINKALIFRTFEPLAEALSLALTYEPTAILAQNDILAAQIRPHIPEKIALAGSGNTALSEFLNLTTVQFPLQEMVAAAVQSLLTQIAGQPVHIQKAFPAQLIVRQSTVQR